MFSTTTTTTTSNKPHNSTSNNKPRIVILGTGWGGYTLANRLDKNKFDVRVISPANHFLFTPLLPGTAVGTLEFRAIQEPVRTIRGLGEYYQAKARTLDTTSKTITCQDIFKKELFDIQYDFLIIATGNKTNTFNIEGIDSHEGKSVLFLKHLYHARQIRNRILECFERASNPNISVSERQRLLSFIVVGGGPTSCEFTTELYDFIHEDVSKWYPDLKDEIKLTLVEAGSGLLGSFHQSLSEYYLKKLQTRNVDVRLKTAVTGVCDQQFDNTELPFGMMVWSAGLAPVKFVQGSGLSLHKGRIEVDEYLRVPDSKGRIFALGDNAIVNSGELPPTASVAEQQAYYISDCFNNYYYKSIIDNENNDNENNDGTELPLPGMVYMNRGAMAGMGFGGGVMDLTKSDLPVPKITTSGLAAFLQWRSVYLTKQLSYTNMILIPMYWFKQIVFGRDISRF
ncbi:FAD/NAD(P)-binding domain-containing protein [Fragilariopsis cylindrus CCMP1102]|uniref:NADH:ubiquinone reductase (non-electrogenic) n=1 Tax=Fragilariopsis cylindrus CCMP1102 TaxID=635003 RepID=A0A1E7F400_9STRA|nr:FAD/NAD(P)-binding domain-containing protein [Fragilariopsis cylindrus CCMP1102]|eukprot:OEU12854.1 FAD/NAD(P)-binding domain-containing protein [Fragilariopsis cylindrus CCMP1102]